MSEEIALAAADRAELARLTTEVRGLLAVVAQRDRALDAAHAKIAIGESALGTAQAEITRLEEAMRHAARGISIRSARKRIKEALGEQ